MRGKFKVLMATSILFLVSGCDKSQKKDEAVYNKAVHCWAVLSMGKIVLGSLAASGITQNNENIASTMDEVIPRWRDRAISEGAAIGKEPKDVHEQFKGEFERLGKPLMAPGDVTNLRSSLRGFLIEVKNCGGENP
ncbi:MAG: hypothetical protein EOP09_00080 [Proteobacteria bacterium]|nr:MAG: hypothetical protein EOP09_00080 [Pseudomonadota bacterium]